MKRITDLIARYKSLISYGFFGVCTTAVNMAVYQLCYGGLGVPNVAATVAAWAASVLFAFVTNKIFVFESRSFAWRTLGYELMTFVACRLLTGVLDVGIMFVAVDLMEGNGTLWKLLSNVVVIVLNYVASKLVIFKKK